MHFVTICTVKPCYNQKNKASQGKTDPRMAGEQLFEKGDAYASGQFSVECDSEAG